MERDKYMVRGTGIKTKFEFVQERFGEAASARFRDRLADTIQWPILVGGWYTFDQYATVLSAIADMFYRGSADSLREVGSYSAEKLLTTTYQAFRTSDELSRLVERLPSLYQRFYNCGGMLVDFHPERSYCGFRFTGAPIYIQTDMEVAVGFTKRCWTFMGAEAAISNLIVRPTGASFELRWVAQAASTAENGAARTTTGGGIR